MKETNDAHVKPHNQKIPKPRKLSFFVCIFSSPLSMTMSSKHTVTPLEIWNNVVHSYERIPDTPSGSERSEDSFNVDPKLRKKTHHRKPPILIAVVATLVILFLWIFLYPTSAEIETHREKTLPTLLSVVDTETNYFVDAHNSSVYDRMKESTFVNLEHTHLKGQDVPQLFLDKTQIQIDESISLSWSMGRDSKTGNVMLQEEDIIALYCGDAKEHQFLEAATIAQIRLTSVKHGGHSDTWFIPNFPSLRHDVCVFRLYTFHEEFSDELIHLSSSEELQISMAQETPTAIHLAFTESHEKMIIQFTTGYIDNAVPVARFSEGENFKRQDQTVVHGTSDTYTSEDLCQAPANLTEAGKFYPPGMLHAIELESLRPNTKYSYQVGLMKDEKVLVWSDVFSFTSAVREGDEKEFSYIVYGDQGCPYSGWLDGHGWLTTMMEREKPTSIHHFGDISYAQGAAHIWDSWFQMIQPFSTSIPLLIGIGNHEYDHLNGGLGKDPSGVKTDYGYVPEWGNFADDSGGECGVTMSKRFRMPSSKDSNGVFWYSYNYANVHTTVISSEHDLSPGSPQYQYLEADLKRVDRKLTPWLIVESHRPLYEGEGGEHWWPNKIVGEEMRKQIEDLLVRYKVDVVLAGHYHEYHRTCDGVYKGKCNMGGPIHITVGSAGARLDDGIEYANQWTARYIRGEFGYGKITVANSTDLHFEFIRHGSSEEDSAGQVRDDLWIHRDRAL